MPAYVAWRACARICKPFKEPRNRFQPGGPVRTPYSSYRPAMLHTVGWRNRFLCSINVYKYGLVRQFLLLFLAPIDCSKIPAQRLYELKGSVRMDVRGPKLTKNVFFQ
jgi:hypothetical protein